MKLGKAIRHEWILDEDIIFLNHGSFGATPRTVLERQRHWQERLEHEPVRFFKREFPKAIEPVRGRLAAFLKADPADIVMVDNATTGVNAVLRSLLPDFQPGDELLTTSHVYGAVLQTMQYLADVTGLRIVKAHVPFPIEDPEQIVRAIAAAVTDKTRLAIIDHVTSSTGLVFPVKQLVDLLASRGVEVLIDGAHAPGMLDIDLSEIGADYYTGNCHKWLFAPKGAAFLWTRRDRQSKIHPVVVSHEYGAGYQKEFGWTGTRDLSPFLSIDSGIDFLERIGPTTIREYNKSLLLRARKLLTESLGTAYGAPDSMLTSLCTVPLPGSPAASDAFLTDLHDTLFDGYRIEIPAMQVNGETFIRFSTQIYNEYSEYEALAEALRDLEKKGSLQGA